MLLQHQKNLRDVDVTVSVDLSNDEPETVHDRAFGEVISVTHAGDELVLTCENGRLNF